MVRRTTPADEAEDLETEETGPKRQRRRQQIEIEGMPAGVRAYFKKKKHRTAEDYSAHIYRKVPDRTKVNKEAFKFKEKVWNMEVDEAWLQSRYGGGRYRVIYQIEEEGGTTEVETDDFDIDDPPPVTVAPGAGGAPAAAPVAAPGDRYPSRREMLLELREVVELVNMLRPPDAGAPAAISSPTLTLLEKRYAEKLAAVEDLEDKLRKKLHGGANVIVGDKKEDALSAWPEFIRPFVPELKRFGMSKLKDLADNLLGGGFFGSMIKSAVVSNPAFQSMWQDAGRRQAAYDALVPHIGAPAADALFQMFLAESPLPSPGPDSGPQPGAGGPG